MDNSKINILVVDDDQLNLLVATSLLRKAGMEVITATNGAEAIEKIQTRQFHVVLMDIQMPEMDGFEATAKIRMMSDSYFRNLPILAFTAYGMMDTALAQKHGMTDFVAKPLMIEELKRKITRCILANARPLSVDFSVYSGGDDEFEKELISAIIANLEELQHAVLHHDQNDPMSLGSVFHKVASSVKIVSDQELTNAIADFKNTFNNKISITLRQKANHIHEICHQIIDSLHLTAAAPLSKQAYV